jgi:hypothetical protein
MADESNFTPDEWQLPLESMMMAGIAVSSGLWGLLKESFAGPAFWPQLNPTRGTDAKDADRWQGAKATG